MRSSADHPATRMATLNRNAAEVRVNFGTFANRWTNEGEMGADTGLAAQFGLTVANTVTHLNFNRFRNAIRHPEQDTFLYSFWFAGGAHTIAFHRGVSGGCFGWCFGSHIYAFDPNYGEYAIPRSRLISWINGFIAPTYGAITKHKLSYLVPRFVRPVRNGQRVMF